MLAVSLATLKIVFSHKSIRAHGRHDIQIGEASRIFSVNEINEHLERRSG